MEVTPSPTQVSTQRPLIPSFTQARPRLFHPVIVYIPFIDDKSNFGAMETKKKKKRNKFVKEYRI